MAYDGQGASAFTKGLQSGYNFVDKAMTSDQNREMKQVEASRKAETQKQTMAFNQGKIDQQGIQTQALERMNERTKETELQLKKQQGLQFNTGLNGLAASDDKKGYLTSFANTNSDMISKMGVDPKTLRMPSEDDRGLIQSALVKDGADFEGYSETDINEAIDAVIKSGEYVIGGEQAINTKTLGVSSGAGKYATPEEKKAVELQDLTLQESMKGIQKRVDNNVVIKEAERAKEVKALQKQVMESDAQLTGKAQLPDSDGKNKTYAQLVNEYIESNPGASDADIKEFSRSIQGKVASDSQSVYDSKVEDLQKTINQSTGKLYTYGEAVRTAAGGAGQIATQGKSGAEQTAKSFGQAITTSGDYKSGVSPSSLKNEADYMASGLGKEKDRREFRAKTSATESVVDTTNKVMTGIKDGTLNFSVTDTFLNAVKRNTPQELVDLGNEYLTGDISDADFAKRIGVDGELGLMIAKMTKEYFGGNASNADREVFMNAFGFGTWTNNQTVTAKMKSLQEITTQSYKSEGNRMINSGYSYSTSQQMLGVAEKMKPQKEDGGNTTRTVTQNGKTYSVTYSSDGKFISSKEM